MLQEQLIAGARAKVGDEKGDSVDVESYSGGTGVIRTYAGWYAVSGFSMRYSIIRFHIDPVKEVGPLPLDKTILERAAGIITSDAVWNRADNRKCPATATTWSIYCAVERATIEVTGGFHHRRPAMDVVREIVDERRASRNYHHRLMDYNNDPTTKLGLLREAVGRVRE